MLPRAYRLPRSLFSKLMEERGLLNSPHFLLRFSPGGGPRIAVSVSKKVSKSAVKRNAVRRRAYSAIRPHIGGLPKGLYLLIAKPNALEARGEALGAELEKLLKGVKTR